ncbi:glycoside hydrolase family 88 protein [Flavobacterium sp. Sd200]|uniref:glycoside hydrolase family 88/105 protein n=1 Tax=Flavobacterium sp. Sd200 TaxID=2692211 RepID=UPI00136ED834|nr:glycoside hydrolase family 88 protein [Flavobacterium sp. Sd200]MXN90845.1 glycoside hydrolase family 88 protein [Flavobacterium sp. Sd200]
MKKKYFFFTILSIAGFTASAQYTEKKGNDVTSPLHLLKPDYDTPYSVPKTDEVKGVLDRVFTYLDAETPYEMVSKKDGKPFTDTKKIDDNVALKAGSYRLNSYEWGVTYGAMLTVAEITGDKRYSDYVRNRFNFMGTWIPAVKKAIADGRIKEKGYPLRGSIEPHALDDCGAICAAMIKAIKTGNANESLLKPTIDIYSDFITNKEHRLADGTLARLRPLKNALWLDDLYMGVPALAQLNRLTGDKKYLDDALKQFKQFVPRMFNKEKNVYMHGWIEGMDPHPQFHWARANGWAFLTAVELLDVLPANHPDRPFVLAQFQAHAKGLASYQSALGFWHQLLDKPDSYLETSATAIYTYCIARGINNGWLDAQAYSPMVLIAWNAVATKVNAKGEVEGTCVGTGMGFDPAFYYYRPVNNYAAHGYGPVLMAGGEIIRLVKNSDIKLNDSALQYYKK